MWMGMEPKLTMNVVLCCFPPQLFNCCHHCAGTWCAWMCFHGDIRLVLSFHLRIGYQTQITRLVLKVLLSLEQYYSPIHVHSRKGFLLNLKLSYWLDWLASKLQGSSCHYFPRTTIASTCHHVWPFMWVLRIGTQLLLLTLHSGRLIKVQNLICTNVLGFDW